MLQSLLTQVWSEWYYWLVTILKYSCIIAKSLAWYFNMSCLLWGEDSCNPRFDQSWKSWSLVPATSSNWEWATAASSSHTSAGWTCHTCRLPLSHLCRLNLSHLQAAPVTHLQAEPVTPLQAEPATHQPMPLWHWHPNSRICHPGLPSWQMSDVKAAGQRKWRYRSRCGDRQQYWERLQTLLLVLDWLFEHHPSECRSTTCLDTHGSTTYTTSAKHMHLGSRQLLHSCVNLLTDHMASGNGDSKGRSPWKMLTSWDYWVFL